MAGWLFVREAQQVSTYSIQQLLSLPMTTNHTPTINQLKRGLEIAEKIAALEAEMNGLFQGKAIAKIAIAQSAAPKAGGRRQLSPEAIARIRAGQKRRWAKVNATAAPAAPVAVKAPEKKKGGLTAAGRAKLAAAMKKRWAAAKKSGGPAPTAKK